MGIKDLAYSLSIGIADKFSAPAGKAGAVSRRLAKDIGITKSKIKELNQQSKQLEHLGNLNKKLGSIGQQSDTARKKLDGLWREFNEAKQAGKSTKRLEKSIGSTKRKIDDLASSQRKLKSDASSVRSQLRGQGIDTRNLGKAQDALSTKTGKLTEKLKVQKKQIGMLKKAGNALGNVWKKVKGITLAGAIGTAGLVTPMVATAADFESSMSHVSAITQASGKDFDALRNKARELGRTTSFSASESAEGMKFLGMAGFKTNQIIAAMPGVLNLAKSGATDLGRAADISSDILSGFGLTADQMPRVADVLTKTFTTSNTTLEMLGESMKYVAPIAKEFGVSIEQTAAMTGLLGNVGIKGSSAGTTLRSMLTRLSAPAGEAATALKELGIQTRDSEGNMRNITDIVGDLGKATKRMGSGQRLEILKTLFGEEPAAGIAELLSQGADGIRNYTTEIQNSGGVSERVAKQMGANAKGNFKQWKSAIEDLAITVGDVFLPTLSNAVQSLTEVTRSFSAWASENPGLIENIGLVAGVAFTLVTGLGLIGTVAPAVITGIKLISGALIANPIGLAITGIVTAAALIWSNWETLGPQFKELWEGLGRGFTKLGEKFKLIGTNIMQGLKDGINGGLGWIKEKLGALGGLMPEWLKKPLGIRSPSRVFAKLGGHVAEGVGVGIENKSNVALNAVKQLGNKLPGALPTAMALGLAAGTASAQPSFVKAGNAQAASSSQKIEINQTFHIHVDGSKAKDDQQLAQLIAREIKKLERQAAAKARSALHDTL